MAFEEFDHILYMQIRVANLYCIAHNISIDEFIEIDQMTDFLSFVEDSFEPFQLTGDLGILDEVDEYVRNMENIN